ncbi:TetR family transcriptional regulator, partial [Micrococcus luteus]|uniref:TetR family transcriptional regulator n=1 Tax=Micrococcus luteus TaxID=1270 RepID=UPI00055F7087
MFGREGYARSSLARIAAEAGHTKGAVYSGFAGEPDLFAAACTAQFARGPTPG